MSFNTLTKTTTLATMTQANEISGIEALRIMRALKCIPGAYFGIMHYTYNRRTKETNGLKKVDKCRLRAAPLNKNMKIDVDHYLHYENIEDEKPVTCFKKLIRYVSFPPEYKIQKINWFIK